VIEATLFTAAWFTSGILGVFIGNFFDFKDDVKLEPECVWFVFLGPIVLGLVVMGLVMEVRNGRH
jgi:hypothetical protein